jgi:hypothetical protein
VSGGIARYRCALSGLRLPGEAEGAQARHLLALVSFHALHDVVE